MPLLEITCANCGRSYPLDEVVYRCAACTGVFDFVALPSYSQECTEPSQPGIWKFRHTFGLSDNAAAISLGEGGTPLFWAKAFGREVAFKCEFLNPTGSFKDRGSTVLVSWLHSRGVLDAVEDSSGNAGASLTAYATKAGIRARIYMPENASKPKSKQVEAYGAELILVRGSRSDVAEVVKREAERGAVYASHAYLPFNIPGYATAAYEIYEQLGRMPGAVILPVGQGGLLLGLWRGFEAIRQTGLAMDLPRMVGVQARACAPLWARFKAGREGLGFVVENPTLAEGVRVRNPIRGDAILRAVAASRGSICAVDEESILTGQEELIERDLYVEPTSAIVWDGLAQMIPELPDPVVVILTGSGYKSV